MIEIIRECRKIIRNLNARLSRVKTKYVECEDLKKDIREAVEGYFRTDRPIFLHRLKNEKLFPKIDRGMQNLLRFTYERTMTARYRITLTKIQREWELLEVKSIPLFGDMTGGEVPELEPIERAIIMQLQESCPSASVCYKQAIEDLRTEARLSWRGTAVEFREALRELLDCLAPDNMVENSPGFKRENAAKGPTMKQKVAYILKTRQQPENARKTVEQAIEVVDEKIGGFVRSVYDRSSGAVHFGRNKAEVESIKLFVDTALIELLDIQR